LVILKSQYYDTRSEKYQIMNTAVGMGYGKVR